MWMGRNVSTKGIREREKRASTEKSFFSFVYLTKNVLTACSIPDSVRVAKATEINKMVSRNSMMGNITP